MEIILCSFNKVTREFQYSCAGGELLRGRRGEMELLRGNKFPVGGWQIEKNRRYDTRRLILEEGDLLYFYSDGVRHQFDARNQVKFSRRRLIEMLSIIHGFSLREQGEFFTGSFRNWKSNGVSTDDVTFIALSL